MRIRVLGWLLLLVVAAIVVFAILGEGKHDAQPPSAYLTREHVVFDEQLQADIVGDRVLVTLHADVGDEDLGRVLASLGFPARVVSRVPQLRLVAVEVPREQLHAARFRLGQHPYVAAAAYSFLYGPSRTFDDPALGGAPEDDWGLQRIDVSRAWDVTTGGALIAVLDSGTMLTHEETTGRTTNPWSYFTSSSDMQAGRVPVDTPGGERWEWITGHGTHVAVTAAGRAGNGAGTAGVAPDSPILPIQVLGYVADLRSITGSTEQIAQGIRRAADQGAAVVNLSLGRNLSPAVRDAYLAGDPEVRRRLEAAAEAELDGYRGAIDHALARGVILVKSAGNNRLPAALDGMSRSRRVISVAATASGDGRASFSNHGDFTTVSAPGAHIWSAWPDPGEPYVYLDGTSMAAPHVTGIVALMKSVDPDLRFEDARQILVDTGTRLRTDLPIGPLVNAAAAVEETQRRAGGPPTPPEPPLLPEPPAPPTQPELPPADDVLARPDPWNHPDVQRLIDLWLSISTPPGPPENAPWFWDRYGRMLNNRNVFATQPPDWASYRYRFLWERAKEFRSVAHGTLYEFIMGMLRDGRFDPAPGTPPDAPPDTPPDVTPTPAPDGPKPVLLAKTPEQLYAFVLEAVKTRHLERLYDLLTLSARDGLEEMIAEMKREVADAPLERAEAGAREAGFSSLAELQRADVRTFLHRLGVAQGDELAEQARWVRLRRVELDPDGRSGTLITIEKDGVEDPVRIRFENGGWRVDPEDL